MAIPERNRQLQAEIVDSTRYGPVPEVIGRFQKISGTSRPPGTRSSIRRPNGSNEPEAGGSPLAQRAGPRTPEVVLVSKANESTPDRGSGGSEGAFSVAFTRERPEGANAVKGT